MTLFDVNGNPVSVGDRVRVLEGSYTGLFARVIGIEDRDPSKPVVVRVLGVFSSSNPSLVYDAVINVGKVEVSAAYLVARRAR